MSSQRNPGRLVPLTIYTTGEREITGMAWVRDDEVVCYIDEEAAGHIGITTSKGTLRAFRIVPDADDSSEIPSKPQEKLSEPGLLYRTT